MLTIWEKLSELIYITLYTRVFASNTVTLIEPTITGDGTIGSAGTNNFTDIAAYLKAIYQNIIRVVALIAVLSLAWWGLKYITSNIPGMKAASKERLFDILVGILVLLGAYLILKTINPNIFKDLSFGEFFNTTPPPTS